MTELRAPSFTAHAVATVNGAANRLLIPLLKSSAGGRLGRRLAVVEYAGRRTGVRHQLVALYAANGTTVRINVGMPESKTWWRNFEEPRPLRLRLAGADHDAHGHLSREGDHVRVIAELEPGDDCSRDITGQARESTEGGAA